MKRNLIPIVIASALLVATPGLVLAQNAAPAATTSMQGSPSQLVLANSQRVLSTLQRLEGVDAPLNFSADVIGKIFTGEITSWKSLLFSSSSSR